MAGLVVLILGVVLLVGAFFGGYALGRADRLPSGDRKRLRAAEELIDSIQADAADHVVMGEKFPAIVLDEIRTFNRKATT